MPRSAEKPDPSHKAAAQARPSGARTAAQARPGGARSAEEARPGEGHRARLLAAAVRCLRDRGYARTTARDLVRESGTNLGSIPYHFGSKDALLNEAVALTMEAWCAEVEREAFADEDASPEERLRRTFAATIDRFEDIRPYLVAFVEAFPPAVRSDELRAVLAEGYARCRATGAAMLERTLAPSLPPEHATVLASLILAVCDGLILQWLLDPAAVPTSDQVMEALEAATRLRT
ncbi:MAG TPA: TetR/AcrR family transcriptional regulator [Solirubrobacteraceae bacterium]|nr:TetR/AcrR family transcriptional regulator [Solirubrobacteraceae bacterium]